MPDGITRAPSARSKCRGCGRGVAKGELRFGESQPNPFGEGEAMLWFHLQCSALMRPEKILAVLDAGDVDVPEPDWLRRTAKAGVEHDRLPRLVRAERAPSSRAACRSCREPIEKGSWRLALQAFEDGRFSPIGTIHVECARAYFGTEDLVDRVRRLTPNLTDSEVSELERLLAVAKPAAAG